MALFNVGLLAVSAGVLSLIGAALSFAYLWFCSGISWDIARASCVSRVPPFLGVSLLIVGCLSLITGLIIYFKVA